MIIEIEVMTDDELKAEQWDTYEVTQLFLNEQFNTWIVPNIRRVDECWEWVPRTKLTRLAKGRGKIYWLTSQTPEKYAYRLSYYLWYGEWPTGGCRHLCGNCLCVKPEHLASSTISSNELDTRFHTYLQTTFGMDAPFPLAFVDWGVVDASGEELYQIWRGTQ